MNLLDPEELSQLLPAETHAYASPVPTLSVSSDEFMPAKASYEQEGPGRSNLRYGYVVKARA